MNNGVLFNIDFQTNVQDAFKGINETLVKIADNGKKLERGFFKTLGDASLQFNQIGNALNGMRSSFQGALEPGIALNTSMHDLSAITGITGTKLKEIETNARLNAKAFGVDAASSVESYKLILSKLGPEIAQNSEALKINGHNVSVLSKTMGNDSVASVEMATTCDESDFRG